MYYYNPVNYFSSSSLGSVSGDPVNFNTVDSTSYPSTFQHIPPSSSSSPSPLVHYDPTSSFSAKIRRSPTTSDAMLASVYASLSFFGGMLLTVCVLALTKFIEYRLHGYRMPWANYSASIDKLPRKDMHSSHHSTSSAFGGHNGGICNSYHSSHSGHGHNHGSHGHSHHSSGGGGLLSSSSRYGHRAGQYRLGPCVIEKSRGQ
ncbi:uncharacterized protein LOC142348512 [Convolutriloba macropyga]|uniref:uncharacterized protein LOC142348512 n=1 Tax=Convolutriloba macropyga TaxID=536237 RepID=UPI003F5229A4